jgi:hypothetical protein
VAINDGPLVGAQDALIAHLGHYADPNKLSSLQQDLESLPPVSAGVVETASAFLRTLFNPSMRPFE